MAGVATLPPKSGPGNEGSKLFTFGLREETVSELFMSRTRTSGLLQHVCFCEFVGFQSKRTNRDLHLELFGLRGAVGNRPMLFP